MDKMNYPRGLIRYTTENALEGKPTKIIRPRIVIYGAALLILLVGITGALLSRHELRMDILRDRNALYRELVTGSVENVYTVKVINKSEQDHTVELLVEGLPGLTIDTDPATIVAKAGELTVIAARVQADPKLAPAGGHEIHFLMNSLSAADVSAQSKSRFYLPTDRLSPE
jgi:polyferredoxin